jgi:ATP-dependent RNA helicase DDX60
MTSPLTTHGVQPALIFSFDRHQCETQAQRITSCLEDSERHWRATSPEWQIKLNAWEQYQAKAKERDRAKERVHRQQKAENEEGPSIVQEEIAWEAHFNPSDPCPEFSFAGVKINYDKSSLEEDLDSLGKWTSTPRWAIDAIKRGIAVHHSGMNKRYRNLVEM